MKPITESVISKVGFWQGCLVSAVALITTIVTIGIFFGGTLTRLDRVEKDVKENRDAVTILRVEIDSKLNRIEDKMADKEEFTELRKDVKELLKNSRSR